MTTWQDLLKAVEELPFKDKSKFSQGFKDHLNSLNLNSMKYRRDHR